MQIDGYVFMASDLSKFFNTVRVNGWFYHPDDRLAAVEVAGESPVGVIAEVEQAAPGVERELGPSRGFILQFLRAANAPLDALAVRFITRAGKRIEVPLLELANERDAASPSGATSRAFVDAMNAQPGARVLDIGGRARSRVDRAAMFDRAECTVLDILPGKNVDVVGDAHELARLLPAEHFDGILSVSVFEHLMMPWAVVAQMNQVMKPGALALIATHQALGMHDLPWDFWRFSDTAWDALFNAHTGFEVLTRHLDRPQFIIPCIFRPDKQDAELAAGFEGSSVLVRKTGPCRMSWPLHPADINASSYPTGTE